MYDIEIELVGGKNAIPDISEAYRVGVKNALAELKTLIPIILVEKMSNFGLGGSDLVKTIVVLPLEDGFFVTMTGEYAIFVEYGTGIIGSEMSHPKASEHGWVYDVNAHGVLGWWYPTVNSDPNPYKWTNPETGVLYAWTAGQQSRPFMYHTWLWAKENVEKVVHKHIEIEFEKIGREFR